PNQLRAPRAATQASAPSTRSAKSVSASRVQSCGGPVATSLESWRARFRSDAAGSRRAREESENGTVARPAAFSSANAFGEIQRADEPAIVATPSGQRPGSRTWRARAKAGKESVPPPPRDSYAAGGGAMGVAGGRRHTLLPR